MDQLSGFYQAGLTTRPDPVQQLQPDVSGIYPLDELLESAGVSLVVQRETIQDGDESICPKFKRIVIHKTSK